MFLRSHQTFIPLNLALTDLNFPNLRPPRCLSTLAYYLCGEPYYKNFKLQAFFIGENINSGILLYRSIISSQNSSLRSNLLEKVPKLFATCSIICSQNSSLRSNLLQKVPKLFATCKETIFFSYTLEIF